MGAYIIILKCNGIEQVVYGNIINLNVDTVCEKFKPLIIISTLKIDSIQKNYAF